MAGSSSSARHCAACGMTLLEEVVHMCPSSSIVPFAQPSAPRSITTDERIARALERIATALEHKGPA